MNAKLPSFSAAAARKLSPAVVQDEDEPGRAGVEGQLEMFCATRTDLEARDGTPEEAQRACGPVPRHVLKQSWAAIAKKKRQKRDLARKCALSSFSRIVPKRGEVKLLFPSRQSANGQVPGDQLYRSTRGR